MPKTNGQIYGNFNFKLIFATISWTFVDMNKVFNMLNLGSFLNRATDASIKQFLRAFELKRLAGLASGNLRNSYKIEPLCICINQLSVPCTWNSFEPKTCKRVLPRARIVKKEKWNVQTVIKKKMSKQPLLCNRKKWPNCKLLFFLF